MATDGLAARPWLLVPGTLCSSAMFDAFLDQMAVPRTNREIIVLDRPSVDDYAEICEKSGPETVICGFSLGAIVAAHWADRVTAHRIVLFGINPHADDPAKMQGRHDLARDVATIGGAKAMRPRLPILHGPEQDDVARTVLRMADQTAMHIAAQTELALSRPGALPALSRARAPVFALTGTNDTAAPPDQGRAAADAAPMGQFAALDGLGHFALLEDARMCVATLSKMEGSVHDAVTSQRPM